MSWMISALLWIALSALPSPPTGAPLISDVIAPCDETAGFYIHVWDTDPGGPKAFVEYGLADLSRPTYHGPVFLVLIGTPQEAQAFLKLPGREILPLTYDEIRSRYSSPCEIVQHILGSPA